MTSLKFTCEVASSLCIREENKADIVIALAMKAPQNAAKNESLKMENGSLKKAHPIVRYIVQEF